jgi:calcium-dependent protein kinase
LENRITAGESLNHPWMKRFLKQEMVSDTVLSNVLENLCTFNNKVKLKSAIFTFIATQCVSQKDLKELTYAFKVLDNNGDGKVSKDELLSMYRQKANFINPEKEVEKIMHQVDVDGSGFIDYTEFILASLNKDVLLSKENLEKAFALFDKDSSGQITSSEIAEILSQGSSQDDPIWQDILKQVDKDGNGQIDIREFQSLLFERYNSLT